jgi:hypothetical protein
MKAEPCYCSYDGECEFRCYTHPTVFRSLYNHYCYAEYDCLDKYTRSQVEARAMRVYEEKKKRFEARRKNITNVNKILDSCKIGVIL